MSEPERIQLANPPNIQLGPEFEGIRDRVVAAGGLPRDLLRRELLDHDVTIDDVDLVVTGVTPDDLRDRDFKEVHGDEFPVFIDNDNREVALPRTEEKTSEGYTGFEAFPLSADTPHLEALAKDSERRDLTVNAMFLDIQSGKVLDFHGGVDDLREGTIAHVSEAFVEDPIRVLRAARFSARLDAPVDDETVALMEDVADEIPAVPGERVAIELRKTFKQAKNPRRFFDELRRANALRKAFPEVGALHHQEGDAFEHTMMVVDEMQDRMPNDQRALFAALAHDLGKHMTPDSELRNHPVHGKDGIRVVESMANRLGLSNEEESAMKVASEHHMKLHDIGELNVTTLLDLSKSIGKVRPEVLAQLAAADANGRVPSSEVDADAIQNRLEKAANVIENVGGREMVERRHEVSSPEEAKEIMADMEGEKIGNMIRQDRAEALRSQLSG